MRKKEKNEANYEKNQYMKLVELHKNAGNTRKKYMLFEIV